MDKHKTVSIPVDPSDREKFTAWAAHYGMKCHKGDGDYITVYYYDPLNLYWLGANMMGDAVAGSGSNPALTVHRPTNNQVDPETLLNTLADQYGFLKEEMEIYRPDKCEKPNCRCIEIAEQKNGGGPVKSYECLAKLPEGITDKKK